MGDTNNDMDVEIEQKDNKISFLEDKIRVTDDKVVEIRIKCFLLKYQIEKNVTVLWKD